MKRFLPFLIGGAVILFDQAAKWWVIKHPLFVIKNQGLFFGFGPTLDLTFWVVFCLILVIALFTIESPGKHTYPLTLILSGALSNLIDRIIRGGVIDYFRFPFGTHLAFNLADLTIIFGVIFYAYQIFRDGKRRTNPSLRL